MCHRAQNCSTSPVVQIEFVVTVGQQIHLSLTSWERYLFKTSSSSTLVHPPFRFANRPEPYLDGEVRHHPPTADVNQFGHMIVGIKSPDAALEVQVTVQGQGPVLAQLAVKLVGEIVAWTKRELVIIGRVICNS